MTSSPDNDAGRPGSGRRRLVDAIESLSEGVALYDDEDRLVLSNRAYVALYPAARPGVSYQDMLQALVASGALAADDGWIEARRDGHLRPQSAGGPRGRDREYRHDGRCLQLAEYGTARGGLIAVVTDITQAKQNQAAQRARDETNRAIIDTAFDGILTIDEAGLIGFANSAAEDIFASPAGGLAGLAVASLIPEAFAAMPTLGVIHESLGRRRDGSEIHLEFAVNEATPNWTLQERRGAERRLFIATLRDVSRRHELEQQLQQAQKMEAIGALASGIAHDFNNILSIVLGYAGLERMRPGLDGDSRENLDMVMQAGQRARDLVRQILSFSRRSEPVQAPIDAANIVNEVGKLMRSTLPATVEIDVQADLPAPQGLILADASQIHQVLMNLCTNAAQALADSGGILELTLDRLTLEEKSAEDLAVGDYVRLRVRDSGPGMDTETRRRIFEPFFTTKAEGQGTGLGLALVQGIVKDHGGAIAVESEPGCGSTFEVLLPLWQGEAVAEPAAAEALPAGQGRILLVDDEVAVVGMSSKLLQRLGYQVVGETSSLEALETFRANPQDFDLVVTDQTMPGMTGEALVREIKALRADVPIIVCSGLGNRLTPQAARNLGIAGSLAKPALADEFARAVQDALAWQPEGD